MTGDDGDTDPEPGDVCPSCEQVKLVPERRAGPTTATCSHCGATF